MAGRDAGWIDWGRQYPAAGCRIETPSNVEEMREIVAADHGPVRAVGAGHSFSPLVADAETLVSLDSFKGIEAIDREKGIARVRAGSRLHELTAALHEEGLAFRNLGDIDAQSIAGATATATHGTGVSLPCLSAEIAGLEILRADGSMVEIDGERDPDLLAAARVSLGALGIVTRIDFRVVEAHRLHRRTWSMPLAEALSSAQDLWRTHRNFEFYYIPFSDYCLAISHDLTDEAPRAGPKGDDDAAVHDLRRARDLLGWWRWLRRLVIRRELARFPEEDAVDYNWKLLASERNVPFRETEYHLPVDTALDALKEAVAIIEARCPEVFFPIEVRQTAGDDSWLSPFQGGNRISVAVHSWWKDGHAVLQSLVEPVFLAAGGRPHWGKMHGLGREKLEALYPDFARFDELRREWDPQGRFVNDHLATIFGVSR
ncbi:D-arabinono-1,4-lactone oxidase [Oricola thermophila]|uniref:FAD-binding protein n=1 Tax=Oricola thermophila TaxID=2742145 RepID=A0A6N1VGZ0_9HYPH|nr:D-arabinono-1,4-lactone oxidase [Oricola thermophila]QKV20196.1 FAD-binding protein [Oricola thermophila]